MTCTNVPIHDVIHSMEPFVTIMSQLLGPDTGKVLITKQTGEVMITNDGWSLLNCMSSINPIVRIITKACIAHSNQFGGGSKSFILLVDSALKFINGDQDLLNASKQSRILVLSALNWFRTVVLNSEEFKIAVMDMVAYSVDLMDENYQNVNRVMNNIVRTFFSGKFSENACGILTEMTTKLLWKVSGSSVINLQESVAKLLRNFYAFVIETPGQLLTKSDIVSGILIDRELKNEASGFHTLLVLNLDDKFVPESEFSVTANELNFNSFLDFPIKLMKQWIQKIKKLKVSMLLCQGKVLGTFQSVCESVQIQIVDCLTIEQVDSLCQTLNIIAVYEITEEITNSQIKDVEINEISIMGRSYTQVIPTKTKPDVFSCIIGSPSPGLCSQYKTAIYNALVVLSRWLNGDSRHKPPVCYYVKGGGVFYLLMHRLLSDSSWVESVLGKLECRQKYFWTICRRIFTEILLTIPRILHKNSFLGKDQNFRFITLLARFDNLEISQLRAGNYEEELEKSKFSQYTPNWLAEPFENNFALLSHVLDVVVEVLKIEAIVSVTSAVPRRISQTK